jgi:GDP-4-dehydro-6-deoxy-D-mannose reductase
LITGSPASGHRRLLPRTGRDRRARHLALAESTENIEHLKPGDITLPECDLRDATSTFDVVARVKPDWIFHLAAQSFVPMSWVAPTESLTTNILGQLNLFEAVRAAGIDPWIQIACSSEESRSCS